MKQAATLSILLLLALGLGLTCAAPRFLNSDKKPQSTETMPLTTAAQTSPGHIPEGSLYQLLAAEMALDRELPEIALANYIAAAKETQDIAIAARATQIALTVASLEVAIEPALIWAKADKNNLEAQITAGALYIRLDQIPNAIPFLKHAEQLNAHDAYQYFLILYRQLQKEEDNKRVIKALEMLAKEETSIVSAHLALAEIYLNQGNDKSALQMSHEALKIDPKSVVATQVYSESLTRTKGKQAAKEFLEKKVSENPKAVEVRQYYSQFLLDNGFKDLARKEVAILIENPNLTSDELIQFARLTMQAQWFDLAEKVLNRSRNTPASKELSHYFLARLAEMQNDDTRAIQWFKQVLTGPFHVLSQIRASVLLTDKKQYNEALEVLSHTQPSDNAEKKQIILATIEILNKAKRHQLAFDYLNKNIQRVPNDIELLYSRSLVADTLDRLDVAESDLKVIIAIQPDHMDALNALGFMLANKTKRYDEAQIYLSRAIKLAPNNASVLDSMGWLYYKMGNYKEALEILKKAVKIMPDAEISAHLGEVMWKMKDFDGAKRVWNTALEHNPKHENIINVMHRLMPQGQSLTKQ